MKKILKIAQFEFLEKARTKAFIVFTLLFPIIGLSISFIPDLLFSSFEPEASKKKSTINIISNKKIINLDHLTKSNELLNKTSIPNPLTSNFTSIKEFSTVYVSSMILLMLFFMLILFSGGMLIRSLVEEKSNRIIEVLLSSCKINELLSGKILGLSMLGILQLAIWILIAVFLSQFGYIPIEFFSNIGMIIIYFMLGYMFFTAIFVGVGSVVNTEQEAQQFTTFLSFIMIVPLLFTVNIIQYPDSSIVKLLSYIPFTTPPVMVLRLKTQSIPLTEILLTTGILVISIYLTITISAKIFRIGILSYGKHPTLKELFSWLKEK